MAEKEYDVDNDLIGNYVHLRDIAMNGNKFKSIDCLSKIPYLLRLDASKNKIKSVVGFFGNPESLQYLQFLNLFQNKIKELPEIHCKHLRELNLRANRIHDLSKLRGQNLPLLKKLVLKQNNIKSLVGLSDFPALEEIYLTENKVNSFKGLENLPNLKHLKLKKNLVEI